LEIPEGSALKEERRITADSKGRFIEKVEGYKGQRRAGRFRSRLVKGKKKIPTDQGEGGLLRCEVGPKRPCIVRMKATSSDSLKIERK